MTVSHPLIEIEDYQYQLLSAWYDLSDQAKRSLNERMATMQDHIVPFHDFNKSGKVASFELWDDHDEAFDGAFYGDEAAFQSLLKAAWESAGHTDDTHLSFNFDFARSVVRDQIGNEINQWLHENADNDTKKVMISAQRGKAVESKRGLDEVLFAMHEVESLYKHHEYRSVVLNEMRLMRSEAGGNLLAYRAGERFREDLILQGKPLLNVIPKDNEMISVFVRDKHDPSAKIRLGTISWFKGTESAGDGRLMVFLRGIESPIRKSDWEKHSLASDVVGVVSLSVLEKYEEEKPLHVEVLDSKEEKAKNYTVKLFSDTLGQFNLPELAQRYARFLRNKDDDEKINFKEYLIDPYRPSHVFMSEEPVLFSDDMEDGQDSPTPPDTLNHSL